MLRISITALTALALSSFAHEVEYITIADYHVPPVMVYVNASESAKNEMQKDLVNDSQRLSLCNNDAEQWFCQANTLKAARAFVGLDGDGIHLPIGYLCENSISIPSQKYYRHSFLVRKECIEFWHPVIEDHIVSFPEDEEDECDA